MWIDGRVGQAVDGRAPLAAGRGPVRALGGATRSLEVEIPAGGRVDVVDPVGLGSTDLARLEDPAWQPLYGALLRRAAGRPSRWPSPARWGPPPPHEGGTAAEY